MASAFGSSVVILGSTLLLCTSKPEYIFCVAAVWARNQQDSPYLSESPGKWAAILTANRLVQCSVVWGNADTCAYPWDEGQMVGACPEGRKPSSLIFLTAKPGLQYLQWSHY